MAIKCTTEYKVISESGKSDFNKALAEAVKDEWYPSPPHTVTFAPSYTDNGQVTDEYDLLFSIMAYKITSVEVPDPSEE